MAGLPWEDDVPHEVTKKRRKKFTVDASVTGAARRALTDAAAKAEKREELRDCGEIPPPIDPARREACRLDLRLFLETYFPDVYRYPFSPDHHRVIKRVEIAVLEGGRFVEAVYRGFGKTSIVEGAAIWAALYGHRRFVPVIGAEHTSAEEILESIKSELLANELLGGDFPEVGVPLQHSRGTPQRVKVQTCCGEPTNGEWTADKIALPSVRDENGEWYPSSGNVILTASILGRLRGMKHKSRGQIVRPDFVIIDDPQTDESSASPSQVEKRLNVLKKTIFGLAGHDTKMSVIIPATVICKDDLIDQLLDHDRNPSWATERIKMVRKWSDVHETLWLKEYRARRQAFDPEIEGDAERAAKDATAFYEANRAAMDAGAEVSWEHCRDDTEISAVQHAYNRLIDNGQEAFDSECQCEPKDEDVEEAHLVFSDVAGKLNSRPRGEVPKPAACVTAFIDLQEQSLFWLVAAWAQNFTGWVLDYGVYPQQTQTYFQISDMKHTLKREFPGRGQEALWRAGLDHVVRMLMNHEWLREDGTPTQIERLLIDANQGQASEVVRTFIAESRYGTQVLPYMSRGVGASEKPFSEYHRRPGDKVGLNWRVPAPVGRAVRHLLADVNFWKSFVKSRWKTALGDPGCMSVFGSEVEEHRLFIDHMLCERGIPVEGRGRKLDEWRLRRGNFTENHWWDGLVGAAVAASVCGCTLGSGEESLHGGTRGRAFQVVGEDELSRMRGGRR